MQGPLFQLGQIVATPGAMEALTEAGIASTDLIVRHATGDWGDVCKSDAEENNKALKSGARILSSYKLTTGCKVWVITDGDDDEGVRHTTTILLPEDY